MSCSFSTLDRSFFSLLPYQPLRDSEEGWGLLNLPVSAIVGARLQLSFRGMLPTPNPVLCRHSGAWLVTDPELTASLGGHRDTAWGLWASRYRNCCLDLCWCSQGRRGNVGLWFLLKQLMSVLIPKSGHLRVTLVSIRPAILLSCWHDLALALTSTRCLILSVLQPSMMHSRHPLWNVPGAHPAVLTSATLSVLWTYENSETLPRHHSQNQPVVTKSRPPLPKYPQLTL